VTPTFNSFYLFSTMDRAWTLFRRQSLSLKHIVNLKYHLCKSKNVCFPWEQCIIQPCLFQNWVVWHWVFLWKMDSAWPKEHVTEIFKQFWSLTQGRSYYLKSTWPQGKSRNSNSIWRDFTLLWRISLPKVPWFPSRIGVSELTLFLCLGKPIMAYSYFTWPSASLN